MMKFTTSILNIFLLSFFLVTGCIDSVKRLLYKVHIKLLATEDLDGNASNLQVFSYTTIKAATNNFSSEKKLGEGGYGPVYKVLFGNLSIVYCFMCMEILKCRVQILFNRKKKKEKMSSGVKSWKLAREIG
jgi:hypothetical protein